MEMSKTYIIKINMHRVVTYTASYVPEANNQQRSCP